MLKKQTIWFGRASLTHLSLTSILSNHFIHPRRTKRSTSGDTEESEIKLEWVTDGMEMKVTFANGNVDKILLAKAVVSDNFDVGCLFTGVLEGDHDSEVEFFMLNLFLNW